MAVPFSTIAVFSISPAMSVSPTTPVAVLSAFHNRNNGSLVKSAGAGTSSIAATMANTNSGSVRVVSGTLDAGVAIWNMGSGDVFSGFGTYVGDIVNNGGTVRPGTGSLAGILTLNGDYGHQAGTLDMQSADEFVVNNMALDGPGALTLGNGTLRTANLTTLASSALVISGGTLVTSGAVQLTGAFLMNSGTLQLVNGGTLERKNNVWRGGTITGSAPLVLGVSPGDDTTLDLDGAGTKTLDSIVLDMNLNDVNVSGSGDLVLQNGAVIDNAGGMSFHHSGNGDIRGNGVFDNRGGLFANLAGDTAIGSSVVFINDSSSVVDVKRWQPGIQRFRGQRCCDL